MTEQISITIPLIPSALKHTAKMLISIADDLNPVFTAEEIAETVASVTPSEGIPAPAAVAETPASPGAKEIFGNAPPAPAPEELPAITIEQITEAEINAGNLPAVDLDKDGLPWDVRIHASTKTTLAKTGQWKKKRGVDPTLVEEVEAELRAAIAIPAPEASAGVGAVSLALGEAELIDTFPKLMQAITAADIDPDTVQAAVAAVGLASLPLVATRPDLIPAVAQGLGL